MPYLHVHTNVRVEQHSSFLACCSQTVAAALGKPESYVMVELSDKQPMLFAGTDAPLVFVELKSLGLTTEQTADVSKQVSAMISGELGVDHERIYIEFAAPQRAMFGWKGGTF